MYSDMCPSSCVMTCLGQSCFTALKPSVLRPLVPPSPLPWQPLIFLLSPSLCPCQDVTELEPHILAFFISVEWVRVDIEVLVLIFNPCLPIFICCGCWEGKNFPHRAFTAESSHGAESPKGTRPPPMPPSPAWDAAGADLQR